MLDKLPHPENDGLIIPDVGPWAESKYHLVWNYAKMFTTSMKGKWDSLVCIDLYAGAGYSQIRDNNTIVLASPLLTLEIPSLFNKYIFCEENSKKISALRERVCRDYPAAKVQFIEGDVTRQIDKVLEALPARGRRLIFCFIDPYKISNFSFEVIRGLSSQFMDFMILIPSYMDANRNEIKYTSETNISIEDFTGDDDWRVKWESAATRIKKFGLFVADLFGQSMKNLGYLYEGTEDMVEIRYAGRNLPLYHIAFFSRNKLGMKFWNEARKYSTGQGELF